MERFRKAKELFFQASEIPPAGRSAFLLSACAGDPALRAEVEALFRSNSESDDLLGSVVAASAGAFDTSSSHAPSRIGPYEIVREIGHGGMGAVYLAIRSEERFEKKVALKIIGRGMNTDFVVRRFLAERQILASLDHPNIARLYDGGATEDGLPWFAMEYIEGEHLPEHCDFKGLSVHERVELFRQVCAGVQYAHQHLVVHRDIKPSNILVTADGTAKLLDFGLAKLLLPETSSATIEVTATALRMFTPEYASPEQVRGEVITTASDVYSLGVVLYRLLTGKTPYRLENRSPESIARAVAEQEIEPATRTLGSDLDNILRMALRKDPLRRYASAEQLSEDLRRYLEELPVAARPDTLAYRTTKFVARHRIGVAAATLVAASLVAGTSVAVWQAKRATEKAALAEKRFNDVRNLANTYLFEFHDAVKDLAGSTPVRNLLVKRALEYLDALSRESPGDPALSLELAAAYARLGEVQGGAFSGNLGDTTAAKRSYEKAAALVEPAWHGELPPKARTSLADCYASLSRGFQSTGEIGRAVDFARKSVALLDASTGDSLSEREHRQALGVAYLRLGRTLREAGSRAEAEAASRRSISLLQPLCGTTADPASCRPLASVNNLLGSVLASTSPAAALESQEKALAIQRRLSAADPSNAQLKRELAWTSNDMASALVEQGELRRAAVGLRAAVAIFRELVATDRNSPTDRTDLANSRSNLGEVSWRMGDATAAREEFAEARDGLEGVLAVDPGNYQARGALAFTYDAWGRTYFPAHDPGKKRFAVADVVSARAWFQKSADIYREMRSRAMLAEAYSSELKEVERELTVCDERLSAAR